ncbi:MAG: hypothetical protein J5537_09770 [Lachnospiraceae bacterium]|nr:hypothetical protein [Lachnospiraceae bacterium]
MMNKNRVLHAIIICVAFALTLSLILLHILRGNGSRRIGNLNDYTPLAVVNDNIVYNYFGEDGTFVIGCYDTASRTEKDCYFEDNFYISSGVSVETDNLVYLPITLTNGEHNLLEIDVKNQCVTSVLKEHNSYPIDTVAAMDGDVYMLSTNIFGNDIEESVIKKYSGENNNAVQIIKKDYNHGIGERIIAFSCYENKIYILVEYINENDVCCRIEKYDNQKRIETINLEKTLERDICNNGIVQFYCIGDYVYFRDYTDEGYIGKNTGAKIENYFNTTGLRIVNGSGRGMPEYQLFYVRRTADLYALNLKDGRLTLKTLPLSKNESIRGAVANNDIICISLLDESDEETFTTRDTLVLDIENDIIECID